MEECRRRRPAVPLTDRETDQNSSVLEGNREEPWRRAGETDDAGRVCETGTDWRLGKQTMQEESVRQELTGATLVWRDGKGRRVEGGCQVKMTACAVKSIHGSL